MTKINYIRQRDIIGEGFDIHISLIGVGAIGRQVALQSASCGVQHIELVDFDRVEDLNLPIQGFLYSDLGKFKTAATGRMLKAINPDIDITEKRDIFTAKTLTPDKNYHTVFSCVDSIDVRKEIFNEVTNKDNVKWFIDGRMAAETARAIIVDTESPEDVSRYKDTLFNADEAFPARCTAKATIYTASIAAGLMLAHFSQALRNNRIFYPDVTLNIFSMEIFYGDIDAEPEPEPEPEETVMALEDVIQEAEVDSEVNTG